MSFKKQYSDENIKVMTEMWREGKTAIEIGEVIGKSEHSVRMFMKRNRSKYDFEKRQQGNPTYDMDKFEKAWYGSVPFGHWMITKPWRKAS